MEQHKDKILYDDWDAHWAEEPKLTPVGKVFCPLRMKAMRRAILDLHVETAIDTGCGFGYLLTLLDEIGLDYVGIDVSEHAIAVCRRKGLQARLGDLEEEEGAYDLVVSEGMLEHFINFEPYVRHLVRISKRYILLMQPNHDSFSGRTLVYLTQILRGDKVMFEYNYQQADFANVFANHGCELIKSEPVILDTSRLLLFEKKG